MRVSKILLSPNEYFIINKHLVKKIGLETTLILYELINNEE